MKNTKLNIMFAFLIACCLNTLQATQFIQFVEKGGSTRPWLVLLKEGGNEYPYIVKLYNPKDYTSQFPVAKEILASVLAPEFGLLVPETAIAEFSPDFIKYALDDEQRLILNKKHQGLKFASKYIDSSIIYAPSVHRNHMKEYDFANLFAFDVLIYNMDRGRTHEKPNILIKNDNFILIDHELSMPFIDNRPDLYHNMLLKIQAEEADYYPYQKHLSFSYLRSLRLTNKAHLFDEFEENLSRISIRKVERVLEDLTLSGIPCGHSERIIEYLYILKQQSSLFCKSLIKCIM